MTQVEGSGNDMVEEAANDVECMTFVQGPLTDQHGL